MRFAILPVFVALDTPMHGKPWEERGFVCQLEGSYLGEGSYFEGTPMISGKRKQAISFISTSLLPS